MIETIDNGMDLAVVRDILNRLIERVNEMEHVSNSYNDLDNRPAIDGVTLTSETSFSELTIPISSLENYEELREEINETASTVAQREAAAALRAKMDSDFTALPQRRYELYESMLIAIDTGKGEVFSVNLGDFVTYLKYLLSGKWQAQTNE